MPNLNVVDVGSEIPYNSVSTSSIDRLLPQLLENDEPSSFKNSCLVDVCHGDFYLLPLNFSFNSIFH